MPSVRQQKHTCWSGLARVAVSYTVAFLSTFGGAIQGSAGNAGSVGTADFVLTQRSTRMGDQYVYISPYGWQMVNPRSGVTMVTRAPDWNVTLFNSRSYTYYEMTAQQWARGMAASHGFKEWSGGSRWVKKGLVTVCGIRGTLFEISGHMRKHDASGHIFPSEVVGARYIVAEDYPSNQKLATMMKDVFNFPTMSGLPLRLT